MEQIGLEAIFSLDQFDKGIAGYLRGLDKADNATQGMGGKFGKAFDNMGTSVLKVAGLLSGALVAGTAAATAAMGAFVVGGIKAASDLESQMGGIASIMGETKEAVGPLKDLIMDLGLDPTLKVNANEAADAIEKLASNGLTMTQIMDGAAKSTVLLANSTGADFDTAAAIATDSMALFNIEADNMMTAVNGITGVTVASKFGINDYRLALSQAGGVAAATGVNFDDFNTSITGISNYFASGSDAGTSFKTMLLRLVPTTSAAEAAMGELELTSWNAQVAMDYLKSQGVTPLGDKAGDMAGQLFQVWAATNNVDAASEEAGEKFSKWAIETGVVQSAFFDANGQMKSMADISSILNGAISDLSDQEKNKALTTIFGTDAMRAAVAMSEQGEVVYTDQAEAAKALGVSFDDLNGVIDGGITKFEALQIQIQNTDAVESAKVRMDNFKGSMEILQGVIDTVALQIGFAFLPVLKELADRASELITQYAPMITGFFESFAKGIEDFAATGDWTVIFPEWLVGTITLLYDNIEIFTGALGGLAAILAAAAIPVALSAIGAAMATIISPISLLVIGAMALGAAWNTNFLGIKDMTMAVIDPILNLIDAMNDAGVNSIEAAEALGLIAKPLQDMAFFFAQTIAGVWSYISAIQDAGVFSTEAREALTMLPESLQKIIGGMTETVAAVLNYLSAIGDAGLDSIEAGEALGLLKDSFGKLVEGVTGLLGGWKDTLLQWGNAIKEQLMTIDYKQIGVDILTAIKDGWIATVALVSPSIESFATSISTTLRAVDWKALGTEILNFIKDGWTATISVVLPLMTAVGASIVENIKLVDWKGLGVTILSSIKEGWLSIVATVLSTVKSLTDSMKSTITTVDWKSIGSTLLTLIKDGWVATVDSVLPSIKSFTTSVSTTLKSIDWKALGADILNSIKQGWTSTVSTVLPLMTAVATSIVEKIKLVDWKGVGTTILTAIKDGWLSYVSTVIGVVQTWTNTVKTTITSVDWKALGITILTAIKDGWESVKATVLSSLTTLAASWKTQFSDSVQGWTAAGKDILDKVRTGLESAKATALTTITTIVSDMKQRYVTPDGFAWSTIGSDISNAIRDGLQAAARAAGGILAAVTNVATFIKDQFTDQSWSEIGKTIINGIKDGMDAAAKAAGGLLIVVKNMGLDLMKSFTEINWEEVGRSMARLLKDGFKALAEGAGGLLPTVKGTGQSMFDAFKNIDWLALGRSILSGILTGVKAIAYGAGGLIYVVGEIVEGFTEELFGIDWQEQGQKIIQAIQAGIEAAKSRFMDIVKSIPTGIKQIFTDMTQEFKNIGAAIVDGIGAGITGAKDALMKKAKELANALPGWVREVLGISSPSKVFAEIGGQIVEGLIVGINEMTPKLQSTLEAISSKISGADLINISFSSSDTFASRLRDNYLEPWKKFADEMNKRRQELTSFIANLTKTLNSGTLNGTQVASYVAWIRSASDELARINTTQAEQQLAAMQTILAGGDAARDRVSFIEDQIALMQEAKKLGIDVTGLGVGDMGIENVIKMANIEKRIAELKKEQLFYTALQLQESTKQIEQYKGIKDAIVHVETYNSHLNDQLAMMKKAEQLGLNLSQLWAGGIIRDPNDTGRLLQLQLQIASATGASLENQMNTMIAEQKRVKGLTSAMEQLQPLIDQTNVSSAFGQKYKAEVLDPMLRALEKSAGIDSERVRLMNEYTVAAQKLVEINKKEDQLDFLKQQMDVVKMIQDQDLVGGNSLFDGIAFGVNASIDDLLTLTNRVLNSMIEEVKDELGIHSPSRVFADIGSQMMAGLQQGIQRGFMQPLNALRQSTVAHGAMSTRTLNFAMGGVTINTPMDEVLFESRVLRILERSMN